MTKPTPITRAHWDAVASLTGAQLSGVTYHYLPGNDVPGYCGGKNGVDSDLAAVDLHLGGRGTTAITWAMNGMLQGLSVLNGEPYSGIATEMLDAAGREGWRERTGNRITSVAASWQTSVEGGPETIWAVRISFAGGSIVVALGCASPDIEYMPDELVVVFDTSLARSYKPWHVRESSWGTPVEPT